MAPFEVKVLRDKEFIDEKTEKELMLIADQYQLDNMGKQDVLNLVAEYRSRIGNNSNTEVNVQEILQIFVSYDIYQPLNKNDITAIVTGFLTSIEGSDPLSGSLLDLILLNLSSINILQDDWIERLRYG